MKRNDYIAPSMRIVKCISTQFLMGSEISSGGSGPSGYGGKDTDGSKDPASRYFQYEWDEDEDE